MSKYLQSTCTSASNLLTQLDSFIVSNVGWTQLMAPTLVTGVGYRAHYSKVFTKNGQTMTVYWHLFAMTANVAAPGCAVNTGIHSYASTGFDGGVAWNLQPGRNLSKTSSNLISYLMPIVLTPASALHFTIYSNNYGDVFVTCQYQVSSTNRSTMSIGVLDKKGYGQYDGGMFYGGSIKSLNANALFYNSAYSYLYLLNYGAPTHTSACSNTLEVNATVDGVNKWFSIGTGPSYEYATLCTGNYGFSNIIYNYNFCYSSSGVHVSTFPLISYAYPAITLATGKISSVAIEISVLRSTYSRYSPIGTLPIVRYSPLKYQEPSIPIGITIDQSGIKYCHEGEVLMEMNP